MGARLAAVRGIDVGAEAWDEVDVVDVGVEMLAVASELWSLADADRARAIDVVMARVNARPDLDVRFEREDCLDLGELLPGLEAALVERGLMEAGAWATSVEEGRAFESTLPALTRAFLDWPPAHRLYNGVRTVTALARLFQRAADEHLEVLDLR